MPTSVPMSDVAHQMERIFRPIGERTWPIDPVSAECAPLKRRSRFSSRILTLGAPMMVLAAGGAMALNMVRHPWLPASMDKPSASLPFSDEKPSVYRAASTPKSVETPQLADPNGNSGATGDADPASHVTAEHVLLNSDASESAPDKMHMASIGRSVDQSGLRLDPSPRSERTARIREDREDSAVSSPCVAGSLKDRCIYRDVLRADGSLREAFRRATLSGVSTQDLTDINRQWRQAIRQSQDNPDESIRRFERLTRELDALRADAEQ